jgi:hypothetical protein
MVTKTYSASDLTKMQEMGSAWIFRRVLNDNQRYSSPEDIVKDEKYGDLLKIYPAINNEWLKTFYAQQKTMFREFSPSKFTEFTRDGGFMDFITDLVRTKFKISKKDSWNPADIWCVQNEQKVISDIKKIIENGKASSLLELNALMRTLYKERRLVGISLKLISGKEAKYEEVNINEEDFPDKKNYNFNILSMKCPLNLKNGTQFATQDTRIIVDGGGVKYDFQIKANSTSGYNNLKFEPTSSAGTKARLGKTPLDLLAKLLTSYGLPFKNSHREYPMTGAEFADKTSLQYAKKMYDTISKANVDTGVKNAAEFILNMQKVFTVEPHTANSKLMQLNFLYNISAMKKEERDNLLTDMCFLAQKKGSQFGPFGKLY